MSDMLFSLSLTPAEVFVAGNDKLKHIGHSAPVFCLHQSIFGCIVCHLVARSNASATRNGATSS
jgi:hypothetical protein